MVVLLESEFPLQCLMHDGGSGPLTLVHVPPAADGAAEVVGEGGVLVGEADGADERRSLHTAPVLFL